MRPTVTTANLAQLTAIIKTFERPKCLNRLLSSIQKFYPDLQIMVADDSLGEQARKIQAFPKIQYLRLASDVGISAGRNTMLARIRTPYFLLLNDDLQFNRNTKIETLLQHVASGQQDLAAGALVRCQRKLLFVRRQAETVHGNFHVQGEQLTLRRGGTLIDDDTIQCDLVPNFFIAKTDRVRGMGGWDPDLKLNEQEEFFFRAKQFGLRVRIHPTITAWHWASRTGPHYSKYRSRNFLNLAVGKMGMQQLTHYDGQITNRLAKTQAA